MASVGQVEIASTSSPFGRESCSFLQNKSRRVDLWVHRPQWQTTTTTATTASNECGNDNSSSTQHHHKKDKWARAHREMVFPVDQSVEVSNLGGGVSSLVQKWRGFEANRNNSSTTTTTTNTGLFQLQDNNNINNNNNNCAGSPTPPSPSPSPSPSSSPLDGDSPGEWELSDRSTAPPSSEIERLRVADIIRKLTDSHDVATCDSPPRVRTSSSDQSSQQQRSSSCFSPVISISSPRIIRGRQAFNDLLMQMERDRQTEIQALIARKPVSKFSHRGRIQALLRFRFLRCGMEAKQGCHSNGSASSQRQKPIQPPVRERVAHKGCSHIDNTSAPQNAYTDNQRGNDMITDDPKRRTDDVQESEGPLASKRHGVGGESSCHRQVQEDEQVILLHSYDENHLGHETSTFPTFTGPETNREDNHHSLTESKTDSIGASSLNNKEEDDSSSHPVTESNYDPSTSDCEELLPSNHKEACSVSNREWIEQVSRPRSDWEELRQARYQEMLDPFLDNNQEIRLLLGRRSVTTFLSSGLREQIDRVMISHAQGNDDHRAQGRKHDDYCLAEQQVVVSNSKGGEGEYYCSGNSDEYHDDQEAESSVGQQQCNDQSDDYYTESSYKAAGHESISSDYSYQQLLQVASPCTQQSSTNYYSQDTRPNSSANAHPTIDMELIYDLRGHMEQLHQEMSELRKSIKCCMDMQVKLQRSIKKEVARALHHSGICRSREWTEKCSEESSD